MSLVVGKGQLWRVIQLLRSLASLRRQSHWFIRTSGKQGLPPPNPSKSRHNAFVNTGLERKQKGCSGFGPRDSPGVRLRRVGWTFFALGCPVDLWKHHIKWLGKFIQQHGYILLLTHTDATLPCFLRPFAKWEVLAIKSCTKRTRYTMEGCVNSCNGTLMKEKPIPQVFLRPSKIWTQPTCTE